MKWIAIVIVSLVTPPLIAQQFGSPYRKDYEKEKNGPHGECRISWKELDDGLHYRAIRCLGDEDDLDVHVIRIDTARWRIDTAVVERGSARDVARDHQAPFAINANFFDRPQKVLGAVVRSGSVVQSPRKSSWQSIFLVDEDGAPHIVMPSRWRSWRDRAFTAVQAGPRLVVSGHTNKVRKGYAAARAGVCIRRNGDLLFFATPQERKFDMYEIARVARRAEEDGGLACRDAMLFDGGHSTQIYAQGGDDRIEVRGDPVPVFLYASER